MANTKSLTKKQPPEWLKKISIWEILAFILPFIFVGIGFYKKEMHPFGDNQFLVTDLWHQYYPFFEVLWEKLRTGGSLLYTWRSGLGTNFLAIMAYYAASPLNLLAFLMPREFLRTGLMMILMFKFSFAGLFMAKFIRYTFKQHDISITMFGVMYALCSYMMGYYWNIIWIDTVALLPLVMMGLVALVREGKYRTYTIALGLALLSNYYIAYMICIFTVIAFFLLCLYEGTDFRTFGKRFGTITGCSVLGAGLSGFIIVPAFFALQLTHSANNSFPKDNKFYEAWRDIVANMLAFTKVTSKEGLPNLYCGLLPVLLLGAFIVAKNIRLREKISGILLMAFLIVSCNFNKLNFIWHCFHFPNMLPYRFSFLFSFVVLVAGYRAYQILMEEKLNIVNWIGMLVVGGVFIWLGYSSGIEVDDEKKFVYMNAILGGIYLVVVFFRMFAPKQVVQVFLAIVLCFEMGTHAIEGVKAVGSSSYTSYPANDEDIQMLLDQVEGEEAKDGDIFSRTELTMWYTLNDPSLYLFDGVSQFSSMANESVSTYIRLIGLPASEAGNRYYYANTSPLTNMLLDVKYIMAKDGYNADTFTQTQIGNGEKVTLYKNNYSLNLGFMVEPDSKGLELDEALNPFQEQNLLFKRITGMTDDLFTQIDITHVGHSGYDVTRTDYGKYNFSRQADASGDTFLKYNYTAVRNGMMYAMMKVTDGDNMDIYFNGTKLHRYNTSRQPYITPIGSFQAGDLVNVRCDMDEDAKKGTVQVYVYQLNESVLLEGYNKLKQSVMTLTRFSDTKVEGEITAQKDGCLYLSIPYEEGWTATVDGQKAEIYPIFGAMCAIDLTAGTHTVKLKYTPKGFVAGVILFFVSVAILVLLYMWERNHPKKAISETAVESGQTTETAETPEENSPELSGSENVPPEPETNSSEEENLPNENIIAFYQFTEEEPTDNAKTVTDLTEEPTAKPSAQISDFSEETPDTTDGGTQS